VYVTSVAKAREREMEVTGARGVKVKYLLRARQALARGGDTEVVVKEEDIILILSWEKHQFRNIGEEKLQFLCTKETVS
jgi:hypothetical protein